MIPAQGFAADGDKIRRPGLKKPERTYRGEISYVGFTETEAKHYQIGKAIVEVKSSQNDEMAVLNTSPFYVCQQCGYTEMDTEHYTNTLSKKHKISSGFPCSNQKLRRFSLGYRFLTDVVRIRFENYEINEFEKGLSILHGFLASILRKTISPVACKAIRLMADGIIQLSFLIILRAEQDTLSDWMIPISLKVFYGKL